VIAMTMPGFHANMCLSGAGSAYRSHTANDATGRSASEIEPSAIIVWTGHCGCYADLWWGLPCVCYDVVADPVTVAAR
jgi:hypothetical protein